MEIKLPVRDRSAVLRRLKSLRARRGPRMHELNTLYDTPAGALFRAGKLVRVRVLTPAPAAGVTRSGRPDPARAEALLTYKGPMPRTDGRQGDGRRYKIRQEHELRVLDYRCLERVLEGVGLRPSFRYEKYRTTFTLPGLEGLLVDLDETPVGEYLELEGAPELIDAGAGRLGYTPDQYITKSYGQLFFERQKALAGRRRTAASHRSPPAMMFAG